MRVRLPGIVLTEILGQTGPTPVEKIGYLLTADFLPSSISELAALAGVSRKLVAKACSNLARLGWMAMTESAHSLRPVALIPPYCQERMGKALKACYEVAGNRGEFLMKRCLDLLVRSEEFVDNARPRFLTNPTTGEPLEYDRYYLQGVAFEYNGAQHYETTGNYRDEKTLGEAKSRDLVKEALSTRKGVILVTITSDDLDPATLAKLLPASLLLNTVFPDGEYFQVLSEICGAYRAAAARYVPRVQQSQPGTKK